MQRRSVRRPKGLPCVFVAVKSEEKPASSVIFRTRLLVRQRTQVSNSIRGHLAEDGLIARQGPLHVECLAAPIENPQSGHLGGGTIRSPSLC